ncbi:MAG: hypothetical protein ACRD0P_06450 [Stackebrandtia sp.]
MTTSPTPDDGAEPAPDGAEAAVTAGLRAVSGTYPPLPAAVAQRLDRTLAELPELDAPGTPAADEPPAKQPWWRRRYAMASGLLAVVAVVGGGVLFAAQPWQTSPDNAAGNAESEKEAPEELKGQRDNSEKEDSAPGAEGEGEGEESSAYTVGYSGHDYGPTDLGEARNRTATGNKSSLPPELDELSTDTAARDDCLSGLIEKYGGSVTTVDFGLYEGDPAMVAVLEAEPSGGTVAAVGPECRSSDRDLLGYTDF